MSSLSTARDQLAAAVSAAGFLTFTTAPEVATPPLVFVAPGAPYLSYEGATFGSAIIHHQIVAVASAGTNDRCADELDEMVLSIVTADLGDHQVDEVEQPGRITLNNQPHLGVAINTQIEIRL